MYTSACRFDRGVPAQQRLLWCDQQSAFLHMKYKLQLFACRTTNYQSDGSDQWQSPIGDDTVLLLRGRRDKRARAVRYRVGCAITRDLGMAGVCLFVVWTKLACYWKNADISWLSPTIAVATPVTCRTRVALCIYHNMLHKCKLRSPFPFGDRTVVFHYP